MTVTLELKPEIEAAAYAEARAQGMPLEHYLQSFLERTLPQTSKSETDDETRQKRMEILARLQGKYACFPGGSEEFAARKAEEKALEKRLGKRRNGRIKSSFGKSD